MERSNPSSVNEHLKKPNINLICSREVEKSVFLSGEFEKVAEIQYLKNLLQFMRYSLWVGILSPSTISTRSEDSSSKRKDLSDLVGRPITNSLGLK